MNLFLSWFRPGGIFYTCRCAMCGNRLAAGEEVACADCYALLEYTGQAAHSLDNELAHRLWVKTEVNRCAALVLHRPHSRAGNMVYELKYCRHPEHGRWMGHMMAREMGREGFFDDIDFVIPVPLAKVRLRQRGYNQSEEIARGICEATGLKMRTDIVVRDTFVCSQTSLSPEQRAANVDGVFRLVNADALKGRHVLVVDDVVTTGATMSAVANELLRAGDVTVSVAAWGMARG